MKHNDLYFLPTAHPTNVQYNVGGGNENFNSNGANTTNTASNNLNINLPEHNAVLRLEVELRDKNTRRPRNKAVIAEQRGRGASSQAAHAQNLNNYFVPLEKVSKNEW